MDASTMATPQNTPSPDLEPAAGTPRSAQQPTTAQRILDAAPRYALVVAFVAAIVFFSLMRSESFPTINNLKAILQQAAPLLVIAVGLTILLTMQEFDLSFAAMIGMVGGLTIVLMGKDGLGWPLACVIGIAAGAAAGALNGFLVAFLRGGSFITTLAMGTVYTGVEFLITNQENIYQGVPLSFSEVSQGTTLLGLPNQDFIAAIIAVIGWLYLQHSETGRYMAAIGSNPEAARLSGVPTRRLRVLGFVIVGITVAIVAILITSTATASTPQQGLPFLLPAFASVFLGSAVFKLGTFNVPGTVLGVLFLEVIEIGLAMLNLQDSIINIVQGGILVTAVLMSVSRSKASA
jgi:ribose transport system permease protein